MVKKCPSTVFVCGGGGGGGGGGEGGGGVWDQGIPAVPQKWAYLPVFP